MKFAQDVDLTTGYKPMVHLMQFLHGYGDRILMGLAMIRMEKR